VAAEPACSEKGICKPADRSPRCVIASLRPCRTLRQIRKAFHPPAWTTRSRSIRSSAASTMMMGTVSGGWDKVGVVGCATSRIFVSSAPEPRINSVMLPSANYLERLRNGSPGSGPWDDDGGVSMSGETSLHTTGPRAPIRLASGGRAESSPGCIAGVRRRLFQHGSSDGCRLSVTSSLAWSLAGASGPGGSESGDGVVAGTGLPEREFGGRASRVGCLGAWGPEGLQPSKRRR